MVGSGIFNPVAHAGKSHPAGQYCTAIQNNKHLSPPNCTAASVGLGWFSYFS
jgi:hypothetical protein